MLKPVFDIQTESVAPEDSRQYRLLMEVNAHSFSYVLMNLRGMSPEVIKCYQFSHLKEQPLEELIMEITTTDESLRKEIGEVFMVYNFEESNLVPDKFFNTEMNKELTELVYGNLNKGIILSEKIPWWELYNVYRIPQELHHSLQQHFVGAKCWHAYSLLLKSHKMFNTRQEEDFVRAVFYTDKMTVMVFKKNTLQLIQSFVYQDRKDVVYHILNCCKQLNLNTGQLMLEVSGMVDRQSALFNELLKYFVHISFEEIDDSIRITDELKEYPLHYFSSLLKMTVCV